MKRIIALLMIILMLTLTSCSAIDGILDDFNSSNSSTDDAGKNPTNPDNSLQTAFPEHPHDYESVVTSPTCTKGGYTTYTCTICFQTRVGKETAATGHEWKAATTESPKTCKVCGATEGDKLPLPTPTPTPTPTPNPDPNSPKVLYVNYINVGQGDSIFIKIGDCDILIDAGRDEFGPTVSSYLKNMDVDDIELMINTHPDNDHYGGLPTVLGDFVVEEIWLSPKTKTGTEFKNFQAAIQNEGLTPVNPAAGTVFSYAGMTLTVVYDGVGATNSNDSSIIVKIEYGSFKFLFMGDASNKIESKFISAEADLSCNVLKVGHHGSRTSSSAEFLAATGASYGVIQASGKEYGHPTAEALSRLAAEGIKVYRTDLDGDVVFYTDGTTLTTPESAQAATVAYAFDFVSLGAFNAVPTKIYEITLLAYVPYNKYTR